MSKTKRISLSKILKSSLIISLLSLSSITYSFAFEPIGRAECAQGGFTGEFSGKSSDGVQHKIIGLDVNGGDYAALFGCTSNANIHDVVIESGNITGRTSVGGIVGYAGDGTIVKNVGVKVPVSGQNAVGGIIGKIGGDVNISNSYMSKNVSGTGADGQVGGIVGVVADGDNVVIQNSYMSGDLNTTSFLSRFLGGIVGANYNWDGKTYLVNNVLLGKVNPSPSSFGFGSINHLRDYHNEGANVGLLVGLDQYKTINRPYLGSNAVNHSQYCDDRFGGVWENYDNTAIFASGTLKLIGNDDDTIVNVYNSKASTTRYITNYSDYRYPGLAGFRFPNLYNGSNVNIGTIRREDFGIYARGNNNDPRKISDYVYGIPSFGGFKLLRYDPISGTDFVGGQDTAYSMSSKPQCPFIFTIKPVI